MEKEIREGGDSFSLLSKGRDRHWNEMRSGNLGIQNRNHANGDRKVGDEGRAVCRKEGEEGWAGFKGLTLTSPHKQAGNTSRNYPGPTASRPKLGPHGQNSSRPGFVRPKNHEGGCTHCGGNKHTKDTCFHLHGYPDWWHNRGIPPNRNSLGKEGRKSKYSIANFTSTHNMSDEAKVFMGKVSSEQLPRNIEEFMLDERLIRTPPNKLTIIMSFSRLLFASLIAFGLATYALGAAVLPDDEVKALRDIAKTLGKTNWNFGADPCGGQSGWANPNAEKGSENALSCNCTFSNGTICHVTSIVLKNQNLEGSLPPDLSRFPYLQEIDLSRNYLNGTIPREWGATQMVNISIIGNRFTGPIPKEIGNISTLANFTVEFNQLSGVLPPELGNLSRLEKLHLTSNNFTGQLPAAFEKLTTLKDFRIGDNQFTGEIPNLIENWTNLDKLVIQGSGLSGPIPPGIAVLGKMTDLRISDLQGNGSGDPFPPLANLKILKTLVLRSCNIIGRIPDFVGELPVLTTLSVPSISFFQVFVYIPLVCGINRDLLDLSFNKLDGEIPDSFLGAFLKNADYIYLTGNQLNGTVPGWIIKGGESVDLSYNNFGNESSCQQGNINLFGSASMGNVSGRTVPCLPCQKNFKPPSENSRSTSAGTVVGIVAAAVVFLDAIFVYIALMQGLLLDGTIIAVKQLSSKSKQGNREFVNEIGMISALQHPHLVKLHGCCIEGDQLLLVYEYMENNSLARALFGKFKEHNLIHCKLLALR
ncbi:hypothetical protein DKX38_025671 [Salix brachista]|uniref:Protein kinase domain-containing protein n=1 Tax=Salix brachista TaxID=2182728 RepID=A0A5N5JQD5_9ROSI|nr:hypothetical protein DKX38_025671 [Salix brachista]